MLNSLAIYVLWLIDSGNVQVSTETFPPITKGKKGKWFIKAISWSCLTGSMSWSWYWNLPLQETVMDYYCYSYSPLATFSHEICECLIYLKISAAVKFKENPSVGLESLVNHTYASSTNTVALISQKIRLKDVKGLNDSGWLL